MAEHDPVEDILNALRELGATAPGPTTTPQGDPASTPAPRRTAFELPEDFTTNIPQLDELLRILGGLDIGTLSVGGGQLLSTVLQPFISSIVSQARAEQGPTAAQVATTEQEQAFQSRLVAERAGFSQQLSELNARLGFAEAELREGGLAGRQVFAAGTAEAQQRLASELGAVEGDLDLGRQLELRAEQRQAERDEFQRSMFQFFLSNPNAFYSALRLRQMGVSLFDDPEPAVESLASDRQPVQRLSGAADELGREQEALLNEARQAREAGQLEEAETLEKAALAIGSERLKVQTAFDKLPQFAPVEVPETVQQTSSLGGFLDDVLQGGAGVLPQGIASPGFDPAGLAQLAQQFGGLSGPEFFSKLSPTTVQGLPPSVRQILFTEAQLRGSTPEDVQSIIQRATPQLNPQRQRTLTSR